MDHLPLPRNPAFDHPLVPYVCTRSYDGRDFLSYPLRAHWPQVLPSAQYPDFERYEGELPSNDRELERFFQNWIFFGLLHELLGPQNLYNENDYIRIESGVKYVHTKVLMQRLSQWKDAVSTWDDSRKIPVYVNLVNCLRLAQKSLMVLSQHEKEAYLVADIRHPNFNRAIKISLTAICEVIVNAADDALIPVGQTQMPNSWMLVWWDLATEQELRRMGWCLSQIARLNKNTITFSAQYYLRAVHLKGSDGESSHASNLSSKHIHCDANACENLRVKKGTYKTAHCCQGGDCGVVGPKRKEILERIGANTIPLLQIHGTCMDDIEVAVVSYQPSVRYVALSHIWVDGLGNETSNKLPRCQLLRLQSLVEKLRAQIPWGRETVDTEELHLWLDTLCCPVIDPQDATTLQEQKRLKKLALGQMLSVYRDAAFVLVLDKTLEPYAYEDIGVVEAALRLYTSPWMHRLWTLQEAVLAKNPVIQFQDRAVDLRTIWQDARSLGRSDLFHRAACLEIEFYSANLRKFFLAHDDGSHYSFTEVARAIRLRRVNRQSDEAVFIAFMLKLNTSDIVSVVDDGEQRMCALWRTIGNSSIEIPKAMIFNTFRRLRTEGYHWAPASLQQSISSHGQLPTEAMDDDTRQRQHAALTSRGLVVKLPGFRISAEYPHPRLPSPLWPGNELAKDVIHLRHPDRHWFSIVRTFPDEYPERARPDQPQPGRDLADPDKTMWDVLSDRSKNFHLILEDPRHSSHFQQVSSQMGLIAYAVNSRGEEAVMRSVMTVSVSTSKPNQNTLFERAYELANTVRQANIQPPDLKQKAHNMVTNVVNDALRDREFATLVQNATNATPESAVGIAGVSSAAEVNTSAGMSSLASSLSSLALSNPQSVWNSERLLGGLVAGRVMGRYATVQEYFDPDTVWCVD